MDVLVAAWSGSTNLGDELVLAGLVHKLAARGAAPTVVSVDPAATRRDHGVAAVGHTDVAGIWAALGAARGVVLGGGGLVQDETSPFNLPYHLSRIWAGRARRRPWAGVGLGAGPVSGVAGRALLRATLPSAVAVSARDAASAAVLSGLGARGVAVAADLAFSLPAPPVEVGDRLVACLRPWQARRGRLPAALRARRDPTPEWFVAGAAAALDTAAEASGLEIRFVALQRDRDDPLHRRVAARMRAPATCAAPSLDEIVAEVARGRVVVAMRYHGAVAAVLGARPAVLLGYSPKVGALGGDLGRAAEVLPWRPDALGWVAEAVAAVAGRDAAAEEARERLRDRERRNDAVLDRLLGA